MPGPPKQPNRLPRSLIVAGTGWMVCSGLGLTLGGQEGGLLLSFASSLLVFYGFYQGWKRGGKE